jgi:hypothetical protein
MAIALVIAVVGAAMAAMIVSCQELSGAHVVITW